MKSFRVFLIEAKDRFIEKNRNLSRDQKRELKTFFQNNNAAEKAVEDEYGWMKGSKNMSYDDFQKIMVKYPSGRKLIIKHKALKGLKEGTDYVRVRMKTKEWLAYIPLNYEAAQVMNTRDLGVCSGPWCIGHSGDPYHWNEEVIQGEQVPVYVLNTTSKWVVMIKEGNRKYDVWSVANDFRKTHEGIPNFSIRKELLTAPLKKMYDEIREEYYDEEAEGADIDVDDAIVDYDQLVTDIEESPQAYENARNEFYEQANEIKNITLRQYNERLDNANGKLADAQFDLEKTENNLEELESAIEHKQSLIIHRTAQLDNREDRGFVIEDEITTLKDDVIEIRDIISKTKTQKSNFEDVIEDEESEVSSLESDIETIENIEEYEMSSNHDIDWYDDPPYEDDIYENLDIPDIGNRLYADYFEVMEEHAGWSMQYSRGEVNSDISDYAMEGSSYGTAEELLQNHELYHPDYLNDRG